MDFVGRPLVVYLDASRAPRHGHERAVAPANFDRVLARRKTAQLEAAVVGRANALGRSCAANGDLAASNGGTFAIRDATVDASAPVELDVANVDSVA
jgi:hypothetical protein